MFTLCQPLDTMCTTQDQREQHFRSESRQLNIPLFALHADAAFEAGCGAFAFDSCGPQALTPFTPLSGLGDPSWEAATPTCIWHSIGNKIPLR